MTELFSPQTKLNSQSANPRLHSLIRIYFPLSPLTMSEPTLLELQKKLAHFAAERDWEQFHSPKNLAMALIGEAAEIIEHFQWLTEEQSQQLTSEQQQAVAQELADVFIYLLRLSDRLHIDLIAATLAKIQLNEQRYPVQLVKGNARRASEYSQRDP